jgi:hypothetical protein
MEDKLNWLAYESGVFTPTFQALHLIVHYSVLAVALVLYLVTDVGTMGIVIGCLPGVAWFFISVQALAWRKANSNEMMDIVNLFMGMR